MEDQIALWEGEGGQTIQERQLYSLTISIRTEWSPQGLECREVKASTMDEVLEAIKDALKVDSICTDISVWNELVLEKLRQRSN